MDKPPYDPDTPVIPIVTARPLPPVPVPPLETGDEPQGGSTLGDWLWRVAFLVVGLLLGWLLFAPH